MILDKLVSRFYIIVVLQYIGFFITSIFISYCNQFISV